VSGADWPVAFRGVTEALAVTLGPNDRWNVAALGLHAPDGDEPTPEDPVTAVTYGRTRTRGNFERRGGGHVAFTTDPELFVEAALGIHEVDDPALGAADAQVEVEVERVDSEDGDGIELVTWALSPVATTVRSERVPTTNRGYYAVIEGTVAASRLDVDAYDRAELRARLAYLDSVVDAAGGPAERRAFDRIDDLVGWRENESF